MEASSHGLDQYRLDGVRLAAGGFTNLARDHLDYHPSLDAYRAAKWRLFGELLPRGGRAWSTPICPSSAARRGLRAQRGIAVLDYGRGGRAPAAPLSPPQAGGQHFVFRRRRPRGIAPMPAGRRVSGRQRFCALGLVLAAGADRGAARPRSAAQAAPGRMELVGAPSQRRAGLRRLCPQARCARHGPATRCGRNRAAAGRGVRLRRRPRSPASGR